ncbi:protein of unknown function [Acidithiobacillus ferrivorans]|uniref:Uncharacterized protein n=1 Tax=Acidithiobacillus ferrivorans TaxID=160808 RepID=A0A060UTB7_9PROT|nr:hypothetical protein AFERRI_380010 [Acidithiobacillus ferrivorans]SMH65581.1 protein of unknown function [Acidithiobacillus ferrivorans]
MTLLGLSTLKLLTAPGTKQIRATYYKIKNADLLYQVCSANIPGITRMSLIWCMQTRGTRWLAPQNLKTTASRKLNTRLATCVLAVVASRSR